MAIAFDAASPDTSSNANVSSLTSGAFTIAGTNRLLIGAMAAGAGTVAAHSAMKWGGSGGTDLTQIGSSLNVGANGRLSVWRLIAPTAASQTLYGSYAAAQDETMIGGTSYTGVDQTTPVGTSVTNTGTLSGAGGNMTVNVTTAVGDVVFAAFFVLDGNGNSPLLTPNGTPAGTGRYEIEGAQLGFEALQMQEVVATGTTTTVSCACAPTSGSLNADWGVIAFVIQAVSGNLPAGMATETDSALALDGIDLGQDEDLFTFGDDTGNESSMGGLKLFGGYLASGSNLPVGFAEETDTAFALGSARPVGRSDETDTALALGGVSIKALGLASETDTAFALGSARPVERADETDTAFSLSAGSNTGVGIAVETDTALALSAMLIEVAGMAAETDTALALSATIARDVGVSVETDTALGLSGVSIGSVGISSETDDAFALIPFGPLPPGIAEETDTAFALGSVVAQAARSGQDGAGVPYRKWRYYTTGDDQEEPAEKPKKAAVPAPIATPAVTAPAPATPVPPRRAGQVLEQLRSLAEQRAKLLVELRKREAEAATQALQVLSDLQRAEQEVIAAIDQEAEEDDREAIERGMALLQPFL